jgi:hypothetical protein
MTDRLLEFRSACRLARRRLGVGPPPPAALPTLHTSLAARRANQVNAKLTEIDGRLANLRAAAGREHDAGTNSFDAAAQAAERDCAWADRALRTMEGDANQASGSRRGHERAMAQCLRSKLSERLEALQEAMKARQRALKVQHKRRTKFSHAGPAISTRVQLDTPLFSTAFVPKHTVPEQKPPPTKPKIPPPPPMTDPFAMSSAFSTQTGMRARRPQQVEETSRLERQQQQQRQQLVLEQNARQRLEHALDVEKEIGKLGEVFSRFAGLVAQQAEVVERLDDDVEASRADVDAGHSELTRAHERIRGNRALYLKIFGIVGALTVWTVMF